MIKILNDRLNHNLLTSFHFKKLLEIEFQDFSYAIGTENLINARDWQ